jgi:hypothetical protein
MMIVLSNFPFTGVFMSRRGAILSPILKLVLSALNG